MTYMPDPQFRQLYSLFTPDEGSIGERLNGLRARLAADDPLLVATGTDIIIFPGRGRPALSESFRIGTRGFIELTSISHLGVAVPFLIRLRELGDTQWEPLAHRLIDQIASVRATNSEAYWRDTVAVEAWKGLESKITDLVDYSCEVTSRYLVEGLKDPARFTFEHLRKHFLDPVEDVAVPVPINDMMVGTFGLVFLDMGYRVMRWLRAQHFDWSRMMVVICGRAGRTTAGLTWQTNNMCHLLWRASHEKLPPERVYVAPHAPPVVLESLRSDSDRAAVEAQYRQIWFSTRVTVEVGREMFAGYPAFQPTFNIAPTLDEQTTSLGELPAIRSLQDRRAFITRLRFVMEDPAQQLSNAVAHYILDQMTGDPIDPGAVFVPGFTDIAYPPRRKA
jgi:Domain of unknown function (DUF5624)